MAKRFVDTELWNKSWFQDLSIKSKCLFQFLFQNCDCAGIWETNFKLASCLIGEEISEQDILAINKLKFHIKKLENGKYFLIDYIKFQYFQKKSDYLNPKNNAHLGVIRVLENNNIEISPYLAPSQPLPSPCLGALDKDKEMDKEMDTFLEGGVGETSFEEEEPKEPEKVDPYFDPRKVRFEKIWKEKTDKKVRLMPLDVNRIIALCETFPDFWVVLPDALDLLTQIDWDIGFKPSANWLLKDNNFARLLNGEFGSGTKEKIDVMAILEGKNEQK